MQLLPAIDSTTPLDPQVFAFFKGINTPAVNNVLSVPVVGGLPAGVYRICTINTDANHSPVMVSIAQHGHVDDCIYATAVDNGSGNSTSTDSSSASSDASASTSSSDATASTTSSDATSTTTSAAAASSSAGNGGGNNGSGNNRGGNNGNGHNGSGRNRGQGGKGRGRGGRSRHSH